MASQPLTIHALRQGNVWAWTSGIAALAAVVLQFAAEISVRRSLGHKLVAQFEMARKQDIKETLAKHKDTRFAEAARSWTALVLTLVLLGLATVLVVYVLVTVDLPVQAPFPATAPAS